MRLAEFIMANREAILVEWEAFARTCAPASAPMRVVALRDHAAAMLSAIAEDLASPQGAFAQSEKSKGHAAAADPGAATAAMEHGAGRAESGFTIEQMVAEYRALRASVLRLWKEDPGKVGPTDLEDLTRFNEAIDQSVAESVSQFNHDVDQAKETFLAMLGHDLRLPLGAIYMSARFMLETGELEEPHRTLATRIAASAKRSTAMVGDLLDFTRGRLGGGIPIERAEVTLGKIVRHVVDEISAAHPTRRIHVDTRGEQRGRWDAARLSQVLGNLIGNAVQHGAEGTTITVAIRGEDDQVAISVHNRGTVITTEQMNGIFNPTKARQSPTGAALGPNGSLGLGLYIAERIVSSHGGRITVDSSEAAGTTFTVYLPRDAPSPEER